MVSATSHLQLEILALRHHRRASAEAPKLRLKRANRLFWAYLSRVWSDWRSALHWSLSIERPAEVERDITAIKDRLGVG